MIHTEKNYTIVNANVVCGSVIVKNAFICVQNGIICHISTHTPDEQYVQNTVFDAEGKIAGPGLIDMHIHGAGGADTASEDSLLNLRQMALFLAERGITSFQPTMVMNRESLKSVQKALETDSALTHRIPGVYVEGPFICPEKRGGLPLQSCAEFSREYAAEILSITAPTALGTRALVKTMTFAPELAGASELQKMLLDADTTPAWGHSNAFLTDIQGRIPVHITHLFNAMNGINHRNPGLAVLPFMHDAKNTTFEIICDTVHVQPAVLDLVFNTQSVQNACIISDCMSAGGLGAGESTYLGKTVVCDGKVSRYKENGTLIGSAMLIADTARNLFKKGLISETDFFRCTSSNPARVLGLHDRGVLEAGKKADIVLCDSSMAVTDVFTE